MLRLCGKECLTYICICAHEEALPPLCAITRYTGHSFCVKENFAIVRKMKFQIFMSLKKVKLSISSGGINEKIICIATLSTQWPSLSFIAEVQKQEVAVSVEFTLFIPRRRKFDIFPQRLGWKCKPLRDVVLLSSY